MFVKVLTIIVAVLVSAASSQHDTTDKDDVITCVAPTVERGHSGLVTCNFNVDVSTQLPVIVSVEHYPANNDSGVNVLECTWMEATEMKCQVHDGFQFDQRIGQQLQLNIPEASDVHAGRYVCNMMAKWAVSTPQPRPCSLRLAETEGPQRKDDDGDTEAWVVPVAVAVPVVVVVGGLIVALVYFRKQLFGSWCQGHKEEAEAAKCRGHQDGGEEKLSVDDERVSKRRRIPDVIRQLGKRRADRSDVPVTKGNASARKEGQGDENEPLIPQDGAVPSHVTGTKADCIQDASSLQTQPGPKDVSEVPGLVTGSDDKTAEQGERPSTHVTSTPVGAQPEERSTNPEDSGKGKGDDSGFCGKGENSAQGKGDDCSIGKGEDSDSYGKGEHSSHGKGDDSTVGKGEDSGSYGKGEDSGSYGKGEHSTYGKGDDSGSYGKGENSAHGKGNVSCHGNGEDSYGKGEDSYGKEEDSVLREGENSNEWKKRSWHIREFNRRSKGEIEMIAAAKQMKAVRLQE